MTLVRLENVRKSYRAPDGACHPVLDVPRFEVGSHQQLALAGASGSGKTTLLNIIAGILRADEGIVEVAGEDLARMSEAQRDALRAKKIGYVFQTFNLLQGYTAVENVLLGMAFGGTPDPERALHLLGRLGVADRADHRPSQLSVGQQQRVALARALANSPDLVLADEPTGNLDRANAREALGLLREICREESAALLLVSHDPSLLAEFDDCLDLAEVNRVRGESAA